MHDENLAWRVEQACLKAWPALKEKNLDGWVLRFSDGVTRRANSANPLRFGRNDSSSFIAACEGEYRAEKLPVTFRIPSIIAQEIEDRLFQLDYKSEGESLVLHANAHDVEEKPDVETVITSHPTNAWFAAMKRMQQHTEQKQAIYQQIVCRIDVPAIFAASRHEGQISSLAYGAIYDGLLCLESVVTDPALRRQGCARGMLRAIKAHIQSEIEGICLQVLANNQPAIQLYNGLGFKELYRYHYQSKQ